MIKTGKYWLLGISLLLLGSSLFLNISNTVITNESIVLVFVGILATFIVVGNYAQVIEIRNNTKKQIEEIENSIQLKIEMLSERQKEIIATEKKIKNIEENILKIENNIDLVAAETSRIYSAVCDEKSYHRECVIHAIKAIKLYLKSSNEDVLMNRKLLRIITENLQPDKWYNQAEGYDEFDYQKHIEIITELPAKYTEKDEILSILKEYKKKGDR